MLEIKMLGGFGVKRNGASVPLPAGKPTTMLKVVGTAGGCVSDDAIVEAIWPGESAATGRRGLRNTLHRLRSVSGELLLRKGSSLLLHPEAVVDAHRFERLAANALIGPWNASSDELANRAVGLYAGDLLPDDSSAQWSLLPRARLQELRVRLFDRLAESAESRGELNEALDHYMNAIDADPHDERRYLLAAHILVSQGRQAKALHLLERGAVAMRTLGLPVPAAVASATAKIKSGRVTAEDFPAPVELVYFPESMPWHTTPLSRAVTVR